MLRNYIVECETIEFNVKKIFTSKDEALDYAFNLVEKYSGAIIKFT